MLQLEILQAPAISHHQPCTAPGNRRRDSAIFRTCFRSVLADAARIIQFSHAVFQVSYSHSGGFIVIDNLSRNSWRAAATKRAFFTEPRALLRQTLLRQRRSVVHLYRRRQRGSRFLVLIPSRYQPRMCRAMTREVPRHSGARRNPRHQPRRASKVGAGDTAAISADFCGAEPQSRHSATHRARTTSTFSSLRQHKADAGLTG